MGIEGEGDLMMVEIVDEMDSEKSREPWSRYGEAYDEGVSWSVCSDRVARGR